MEKILRGGRPILPRCRCNPVVGSHADFGSGVVGQLCEGGGFFPGRAKCGRSAVVVAEFSSGNEPGNGVGLYAFQSGPAGDRPFSWFESGFLSTFTNIPEETGLFSYLSAAIPFLGFLKRTQIEKPA